jgi:uncharacterized membrane protein YkoI
MKRILFAAALAATALGTAYAARNDAGDAAVLSQAKITLSQAIASAERHTGGRAVHARIENENGSAVYGVETVQGSTATDVKVDAGDGHVLSAQADHGDQATEEENDDAGGSDRGER